MNKNKKFALIETLFFVVPLLLAFINAEYSNLKNFAWGNDHVNEISIVALLTAIFGNIYIYWQNKKYQPISRTWQLISLSLIIASAFLLYVGNSISHFGF